MTRDEFIKHVNRLASCFGATPFSEERRMLIWAAVKNLSEPWFKATVDNMIGSLRQAPLVPDFVEAARFELNRIHEETKRTERGAINERWVSQFTREDERMMADMIRKRLAKQVPDDQWESFLSMLDGMAAAEKIQKQKEFNRELPR